VSETVYIETSILGYLTARPSRDIIVSANIEITREWWNIRRTNFQLYSSQAVVKETSQGDTAVASQRLEIISNLSLLDLNQSVLDLAEQFLKRSNLPAKADVDAIHIAVATVHGMDYLLTWNCKHIANAQIQRKLAEISINSGYELPILCTPYELLGG
jgi:predicted nucleic acid-binding protein